MTERDKRNRGTDRGSETERGLGTYGSFLSGSHLAVAGDDIRGC